MQKQPPTIGRVAIMAGFSLSVFGLLVFLWSAFGGPIPFNPQGYRFDAKFPEATQLAVESDVRISGVSVGKVKALQVDKQKNLTTATIELDDKFAPIPKDTRAILRQKTLLGETYVELTPGTRSESRRGDRKDGAPARPASVESLPENGLLANANVEPAVELDELLEAFDPETREAWGRWMKYQGIAISGRSKDFNDALGNIGPFATNTSKVLRVLDTQEDATKRLIKNTGVVFAALTEREDQLEGLITNSNRLFETTARKDEALKDLFRAFPTFLDESKATADRLKTFSRDTDPLVTELRPVARELSPTLRDVKRFGPDLKALFTDLEPLFDAAEKGLPAGELYLRDLRPMLTSFYPWLREFTPIIQWLSAYQKEIGAFLALPGPSTAAYTQTDPSKPKLHYLREIGLRGPETLALYDNRLPTNRGNSYPPPGAVGRIADTNGEKPQYAFDCDNLDNAAPVAGDVPGVSPLITAIAQALLGNIAETAAQRGGVPCEVAPDNTFQGRSTRYGQVRRAAP